MVVEGERKKMEKMIMVIMCSLLLMMPGVSFAKDKEQKKEISPNVSAYEHANEKAKFKRTKDKFNNKANKRIRAKKLAELYAVSLSPKSGFLKTQIADKSKIAHPH